MLSNLHLQTITIYQLIYRRLVSIKRIFWPCDDTTDTSNWIIMELSHAESRFDNHDIVETLLDNEWRTFDIIPVFVFVPVRSEYSFHTYVSCTIYILGLDIRAWHWKRGSATNFNWSWCYNVCGTWISEYSG